MEIELDLVELDPTDSHITYATRANAEQDYAPDISVRILGELLPETPPRSIVIDILVPATPL